MAITNIKKKLLNVNDFVLRELYGDDIAAAEGRIALLMQEHAKYCEGAPFLFSSPGRIEVCGNHTDHNNGKVVAAAVTADTLAAVTPIAKDQIIVRSAGYPEVVVDIGDTGIRECEKGTSFALVRGVVAGYRERGYNVGGFVAATVSQVFKGAGMSSSASFEVLIADILSELYNGGRVPAIQKAIVSQYAENTYFGKPSGLMDQASIALGGISYIDFCDTADPKVYTPSWAFDNLEAVVVNCGGDHSDLTPQYAAIRSDMESVAGYFGEKKLRFVDSDIFYSSIASLHSKFGGKAVLRAMHYFQENQRVDALVAAIDARHEAEAMRIISESGVSSYQKLQNCYPEGDTTQPIPLALALCERFDGVQAYRVHGGGFAGTILTFVQKARKQEFCNYMSEVFGKDNVFAVGIRQSGARKISI